MLLPPLPPKISLKVGIKADTSIMAVNPPDNYPALLSDLPEGVRFISEEDGGMPGNIHIFVHTLEDLVHAFSASKPFLGKEGKLWIFFPKKTSRIRTDVDFDSLLSFAREAGMINVQLTDIDIMWSGMEFTFDNSAGYN